MSLSRLLEDFGAGAGADMSTINETELEEQRLEAFERGYQAGWDDSAKSREDDATRIAVDFAQNIRDLSFTYQEAYTAVLDGLAPLVRQIVKTVLPHVAQKTLAPRLSDILSGLVRTHGAQPVEIVTAPANLAALEQIRPPDEVLQLEITADSTLAEGQLHIRFGTVAERDVDLGEVISAIDSAIAGFLEETLSKPEDNP